MSSVTDRVAYLKGLAEGLKLTEEKDSDKLLLRVLDVLDDMAQEMTAIRNDLDELDETSAEAKATYKKITEWVQEHYGFHVTNLNIAQVKRKNGDRKSVV